MHARTVLFLGAFPEPHALDRFVSGDLALRLRALGWQTLVASQKSGRLSRLVDLLAQILRHRRQYRIACIDVFSGPAFLWAEAACALLRQLRKTCVLTLHGGNLPGFAARNHERVTRLLTRAARVTCPSRYLGEQLKSFRPDVQLLPNGLDLKRYHFRKRRPPRRHLIWVRAFHEIYNPQLALEVLHRLRTVHRDWRLTMVGPDKGDGSQRACQHLARDWNLETAVTFTGSVAKDSVPAVLDEADVFLNTSNVDNTPVSVLEAMASGLPVISTEVGGLPYLLRNSQTGLLVPPRNPEAMANAISTLFQQPDRFSALADNAAEAVRNFDWPVVLPQWSRLLRSLIPKETGTTAAAVKRASGALPWVS